MVKTFTSGLHSRMATSTLSMPRQTKYNRVQRALPYPDRGEKGCRWKSVTTPSGRKMKEPIQ